MLAIDALVTDLIFSASGGPDPEVLLQALGGEEAVADLKILDPDMQDPQFEMQLSPSRPFRRRGERRLMIIDDSVAPMREDPETQVIVEMDLRPAKEKLVELCEALGDSVRLGRLFALGSQGEAVFVAKSAIDMRAWALQLWALDPMTDVHARRRSQQLSEAEFEEKLVAFEQRLDELSEDEVLQSIGGASLERRGDWLVVSVLGPEGFWDLRDSMELEVALGAFDRFSMIIGAPSSSPAERPALEAEPTPMPTPEPEPDLEAEAGAPSLTLLPVGDRPLFYFPPPRFDLSTAATLGKGDWETVLTQGDAAASVLDEVFRGGAGFVAPLEFLSEVFIDGKPLSKSSFADSASEMDGGAKSLEVHMPRFGPALLIVLGSGDRFITSELDHGPSIAAALAKGAH